MLVHVFVGRQAERKEIIFLHLCSFSLMVMCRAYLCVCFSDYSALVLLLLSLFLYKLRHIIVCVCVAGGLYRLRESSYTIYDARWCSAADVWDIYHTSLILKLLPLLLTVIVDLIFVAED